MRLDTKETARINCFNGGAGCAEGTMVLDGHIHLRATEGDREEFRRRLKAAGVDGGIVISLPPPGSPLDRLTSVLKWCELSGNLYPFYWIDPVAEDAMDQVGTAVEKGVSGFKVICGGFYPGDKRAMKTYAAIAKTGRPILFHSGILWDGKPSSPYNRPAEFEALLEIEGLKFCLAHISWPWCDECIAVYGKFLNARTRKSDLSVEMFIDTTPGTPPIYRKETLARLFTVGYDVENNVIFGTDSCANNYNVGWTQQWLDRDTAIFKELGLSQPALDGILAGNLRRFVGVSSAKIDKKLPRVGE